jgi:hypothetical protein
MNEEMPNWDWDKRMNALESYIKKVDNGEYEGFYEVVEADLEKKRAEYDSVEIIKSENDREIRNRERNLKRLQDVPGDLVEGLMLGLKDSLQDRLEERKLQETFLRRSKDYMSVVNLLLGIVKSKIDTKEDQ